MTMMMSSRMVGLSRIRRSTSHLVEAVGGNNPTSFIIIIRSRKRSLTRET